MGSIVQSHSLWTSGSSSARSLAAGSSGPLPHVLGWLARNVLTGQVGPCWSPRAPVDFERGPSERGAGWGGALVLSLGRAGPGSGSEQRQPPSLPAAAQPAADAGRTMELLLLPWVLLLLLTAPGPGPCPAAGTSSPCLPSPCLSFCLLQQARGRHPSGHMPLCQASCGCTGGCAEKLGSRVKGPPSRDGGLWAVPTLNLLEAGGHWLPGREVARRRQAQKSPWPVPRALVEGVLAHGGAPSPTGPVWPEAGCGLIRVEQNPESLAEELHFRARALHGLRPPQSPAGQG